MCLIGHFFSCGRNEKMYLSDLEKNNNELDSLRQYIENQHKTEIDDSLRKRLVFVNSRNKKPKYKSDVYDDEVMFRMKKLKIKEIRFEGNNGKTYNEIYFEKDKFFYYPVISYL